jgi:C_GCAxxG_C_C family probable redox protein
MFWSKQNAAEAESEGLAGKVALEAEGLFRSGKMHCAEAVLAAVKNNFAPALPDEVVQMASGFGGGSGSGCLCGAVSGGTIALGMVLKSDKKEVTHLTKELHKWFKGQYGATCCKVITQKGKGGCGALTGSVAGKVAELLDKGTL